MAEKGKPPVHVGIILDGNRRFAKRLMAKPWMGHEWGAQKVEKLFDWGNELGLKEFTLYAFSMQNFNRPKDEFDFLMKVFIDFFERAKTNESIHENRIRIRFLGRIELFPEAVHKKMQELMDATREYDSFFVNFAMAYGGREELVDAFRKIGSQIESGALKSSDIDESLIDKNVYSDHQPDFIIRTGGDHRTSNFLIWQSWYSEWFFLDKCWPEFEKEDLVYCMEQFMGRERRFGR
ncbi:di-trans,poly-cis-decaprenylcistransferase [Candidatus Woesearchaeota archaeon]|nr:di-trans,poly-cis-decaprenylcistransferase [Candidatus Woesearchaeota archaeon]